MNLRILEIELAMQEKGVIIFLDNVPDCLKREGQETVILHEHEDSLFYVCALRKHSDAVFDAGEKGFTVREPGKENEIYTLIALVPEHTFTTSEQAIAFIKGALFAQQFQLHKEVAFYVRQAESLKKRLEK